VELSAFEMMVLAAVILDDPEADSLRAQLSAATIASRKYTGVGLYTELRVSQSTPRVRAINRIGKPGLKLVHPAVPDGAGALIWLVDGRIGTLECYTFSDPWPEDEASFQVELI
jgi:hypothetical protein